MTNNILNEFFTLLFCILLMLAPFWLLKHYAPGLFRGLKRISTPLMNFLFFTQAKRRGWLFTILVHFLGVAGIAILVTGVLTGTAKALFPGLGYIAIAVTFGWLFMRVNRLRGRGRILPGRRR